MSVHIICSNCGKEIQMRTEVLAKNWRASGMTRKQYIDSYTCRNCKTAENAFEASQRSLQDTSAFRAFSKKMKAAYRLCAESGLTKVAISTFQQTINGLAKENHINKFEYVVSNGMLRAIKLIDFPIFGTVEVKLI